MDAIELQDAALKVSEEWQMMRTEELALPKPSRWERIENTLLTTLLFSYTPTRNSQNYLKSKFREWLFRTMSNRGISEGLVEGLVMATRQVTEYAREVEPLMKPEAVFKACRLAWMICVLMDEGSRNMKPLKLNKTLTCYCLLYPLVDDFVDDPAVGIEAKRHLMLLLNQISSNNYIHLNSSEEGALHVLSSRIARCIADMYAGLEECSLEQQREFERALNNVCLAEDFDVMPASALSFITLEQKAAIKGTSALLPVLALLPARSPGWLNTHWITQLGFACQMVDDLQDCEEDQKAAIRTVFSQRVRDRKSLDLEAKRMLVYLDKLEMPTPALTMTITALRYLLLEAVCHLPEQFSYETSHELHKYLPVTTAYIQSLFISSCSYAKEHELERQLFKLLQKMGKII